VILAYHGVDLPIANAGFFGNDGGTFINADTVPYLAALVL
jgi:hypothetical protein